MSSCLSVSWKSAIILSIFQGKRLKRRTKTQAAHAVRASNQKSRICMKKALSLILVLTMVFALFTVSASADGMDDLIAAAKA